MRMHGALLVALLSACAVPRTPRTPLASAADRTGFEADEQALVELARRFDAEVEHMGVLYRDAPLEAYLDEVLARVLPEFAGLLHVRVLRPPTTRAVVLLSGTLYVDAGALAALGDEAQLAAFLAHEAAHFRLRHAALKERAFDPGWVITGRAYEGDWKRDERLNEACDRVSFDALVRAGYDVARAAGGWERLMAYQERPGSDDRSASARRRAPALRQLAAAHAPSPGGEHFGARYHDATRALVPRVLETALEHFDPGGVLQLVDLADGRLAPAEAAYWRARAHALRGQPTDPPAELALLEECLRLAPDFVPAAGRLGLRLARSGQLVRARELLTRAIAGTPDAGERSFLERSLAEIGP